MTPSLSVVIITHNEEANIGRTLRSVSLLLRETPGEIIVVDSGSTDRTVEIAQSQGAKVFSEPWKGYAAQKNSAIEKASGDWILSLDADEVLDESTVEAITSELKRIVIWEEGQGIPEEAPARAAAWERAFQESGVRPENYVCGYSLPRKNLFLGRWIRRGGFYPDFKLRLFRRAFGEFEDRAVHETVKIRGETAALTSGLVHHAYPTLAGYIGHMNKYSSLGAEQAAKDGKRGFSFINIVVRPMATFIYNYFLRLGFLDGREGLLLHLYHAAYTSWKYAKLWELTRKPEGDHD